MGHPEMANTADSSSSDSKQAPPHTIQSSAANRPKTINVPVQYADVPQMNRSKTINGPIQYSEVPQINRSTMINGPIQYSDTPQINRSTMINNGPIQYSDTPQINRSTMINNGPNQYSEVPQIDRSKTMNGPIPYLDQASTSQSSHSPDVRRTTGGDPNSSFGTSMTSSDYLSETSSTMAEDFIRFHTPTAPAINLSVSSKKDAQKDQSRSPPIEDPTRVDKRIEFPFDVLVYNIAAIDLQQVHFLQKTQPVVKMFCDTFFGATQVLR